MSSSMHAITIQDELATWSTAPRPTPGPHEVLIKVHAAGVNRADLVQRHGNYAPPKGASSIFGLEVAGEVVELGAHAEHARVGQLACALLTGGGYAEYAVVHEDLLMPIPAGLSMAQAAALPEVYFTAWLNLFMEAKLKVGERALIHAGASGVGTAAIQLCHLFDVQSIATASSHKLERLAELGATHTVDRRDEHMFELIDELTDGEGVDVILDPVAANYLEGNVNALRLNGRLVLIGLMGGREAEINLGRMLVKRLRLIGSTLRSRPIQEKREIAEQLRHRIWPHFDTGELKPIIDKVLPIQQAEAAHELLGGNKTTGKIILQVIA